MAKTQNVLFKDKSSGEILRNRAGIFIYKGLWIIVKRILNCDDISFFFFHFLMWHEQGFIWFNLLNIIHAKSHINVINKLGWDVITGTVSRRIYHTLSSTPPTCPGRKIWNPVPAVVPLVKCHRLKFILVVKSQPVSWLGPRQNFQAEIPKCWFGADEFLGECVWAAIGGRSEQRKGLLPCSRAPWLSSGYVPAPATTLSIFALGSWSEGERPWTG